MRTMPGSPSVNRIAIEMFSTERGTSTWSSIVAALQPVSLISSYDAQLHASRPSALTCVLA